VRGGRWEVGGEGWEVRGGRWEVGGEGWEVRGGRHAPVMISKSAIVTQPPARNAREGSSWIADRCLSRYCGRGV
jgi:hypothetical protein